jgi:hypothetical protein
VRVRLPPPALSIFLSVLLLLGSAGASDAQQGSGRVAIQLGRALNGPSPDDGEPAFERYEPNNVWLVSGEVMLAPRLGVGAEWRRPKDVTFGRGRAVNAFTQIEREYATFITIVGRVARGPWGSIDVMAGPGIVRQQVTLTVGGSQGGNAFTSQTSETSNALSAVTAGADATMRVVDHLGVGTLVRLTGTNRPTGFVRAYSLGLFVRAWW